MIFLVFKESNVTFQGRCLSLEGCEMKTKEWCYYPICPYENRIEVNCMNCPEGKEDDLKT